MRKIRIKNFRSLVMEKPIEIKPLTLLFGKNGSGKSSFLKAMSFLGQNLKPEALNRTVYQISDETSLGGFESIVINNDIKEKIEIEIEEELLGIHYNISSVFSFNENERQRNLESLLISNLSDGSEFLIKPREINKKGIENLNNSNYNKLSKEEFLESFEKAKYERDHIGLSESSENDEYHYSPSLTLYREFKHPQNDIKSFFEAVDVLPILDRYSRIFDSKYFKYLVKANEKIREELQTQVGAYYKYIPLLVNYYLDWFKVESIRMKPQYNYKLDKYSNFSKTEYYGLISQLDKLKTNDKFESDDEKISRELYDSIEQFLEEKLKDLGLGGNIEIWKDTKNYIGGINYVDQYGVKTNLAEVSSGLLQILPILFKSYFLYRADIKYFIDTESTLDNPLEGYPIIMLEQPELHLHPSLQTKFAEFLSQSRTNFLIETHSEHIVRKIQVLIAQGSLKKEKVAVYYFEKDERTGITKIKEMELEDNGFFKGPWPDGFFDDSYNLTKELLRANKN